MNFIFWPYIVKMAPKMSLWRTLWVSNQLCEEKISQSVIDDRRRVWSLDPFPFLPSFSHNLNEPLKEKLMHMGHLDSSSHKSDYWNSALVVRKVPKNLASEDTTGNISGKFCCIDVTLGIALHQKLHGKCIVLGISFHWEFNCMRNCIVLGISLHWELHCIGNCIAYGIALHWVLHCIRNCIALGITFDQELYCIGNCTVLLCYCVTVLLCYFVTELLYYYVTVLWCYCAAVLLFYCVSVLLCYCITVLLCYYITVLLHYCVTVLMYNCDTVLLNYFNINYYSLHLW